MSEQVIEIPSKRIYDNQNPKIIKNKYATSSIDMDKTQRSIDVDTVIGTIEKTGGEDYFSEISPTYTLGSTGTNRPVKVCEVENTTWSAATGEGQQLYHAVAYSGMTLRFHNEKFTVKKKKNYNLDDVTKAYSGRKVNDIDGSVEYDISVAVTNKVETTPFTLQHTVDLTNSSSAGTFSNVTFGATKSEYVSEPLYEIVRNDSTVTVPFGNSPKHFTATVTANNDTKMYNSSSYTVCKETSDGYEFDITFETLFWDCKATGLKAVSYGTKSDTANMSGELIKHIPQKVSISVYGDVNTFDVQDYIYEYGDESHATNIFNPESNELFQNNTKVGNTQIDKYMSDTVLGGWKNGKETAEIQCSVNDYKSIMPLSGKVDGDAISTSNYTLPFMFRVGNVVCPMKATVSGDKPISTFDCNGGGSTAKFPKLFRVTGISPKYDGALWQTLTLQETYPQYNVTIDTTNAKGIAAGSLIHNVTSSRCTKGSFSSTKPHYGDTMYIEFRASTGYTAEMNISGSIGTTYKNITKSTAPQNRYIAWVYGISDDFDVTITTEFAMTPPIFASIYLNDDNTWTYRDIVNKNNYQVNCKVTVIVDGKVTARDEWRILANSYWDIGEGQSPAAFGTLGTNGRATIKAEFSYTTPQNELITKTSTMQIGGKLAQPEIVYAEFYSNDGQSYVEVEVFNPCPVAVDMGVAVEDENSQVAYKQQRVEAYSNEVIQLDVTSSLDYMNSRVRARSTYFSGSSSRKPFVGSDSTYSQID